MEKMRVLNMDGVPSPGVAHAKGLGPSNIIEGARGWTRPIIFSVGELIRKDIA